MEFILVGFPPVIPDNDERYFLLLQGIISGVDPDAMVVVTKKQESFSFRISPSANGYVNSLVSEINNFHTFLKIVLNWSKSMKRSSNLSFELLTS